MACFSSVRAMTLVSLFSVVLSGLLLTRVRRDDIEAGAFSSGALSSEGVQTVPRCLVAE